MESRIDQERKIYNEELQIMNYVYKQSMNNIYKQSMYDLENKIKRIYKKRDSFNLFSGMKILHRKIYKLVRYTVSSNQELSNINKHRDYIPEENSRKISYYTECPLKRYTFPYSIIDTIINNKKEKFYKIFSNEKVANNGTSEKKGNNNLEFKKLILSSVIRMLICCFRLWFNLEYKTYLSALEILWIEEKKNKNARDLYNKISKVCQQALYNNILHIDNLSNILYIDNLTQDIIHNQISDMIDNNQQKDIYYSIETIIELCN